MQDHGASLAECCVVVCLGLLLVVVSVPATVSARDEGRARQAAAFVAATLRNARQQAVTQTNSVGIVFDRAGTRWVFNVCRDGNANGIRRADIRNGTDLCQTTPVDIAELFPGVAVEADATIRGPEGDPSSGDPVRFGSSDIASFSASGGCTAGSLFLRSAKGARYVVRMAGTTGRLRVFRYDAAARGWSEV